MFVLKRIFQKGMALFILTTLCLTGLSSVLSFPLSAAEKTVLAGGDAIPVSRKGGTGDGKTTDPEPQEAGKAPKRIALTFDDGPHPAYTDAILALLDKYCIHATFFVIGQNVGYYPDVLKRVAEGGHEIGNHTFTHPHLAKTNESTLADELARTSGAVERICGQRPTLFRPPEGVRNKAVASAAKRGGYTLVLWNIDTRDWTSASAEHIAGEILNNARNGSIVLCHDYVGGVSHTAQGLAKAIPLLLEQGYEFVTVSELLG